MRKPQDIVLTPKTQGAPTHSKGNAKRGLLEDRKCAKFDQKKMEREHDLDS